MSVHFSLSWEGSRWSGIVCLLGKYYFSCSLSAVYNLLPQFGLPSYIYAEKCLGLHIPWLLRTFRLDCSHGTVRFIGSAKALRESHYFFPGNTFKPCKQILHFISLWMKAKLALWPRNRDIMQILIKMQIPFPTQKYTDVSPTLSMNGSSYASFTEKDKGVGGGIRMLYSLGTHSWKYNGRNAAV